MKNDESIKKEPEQTYRSVQFGEIEESVKVSSSRGSIELLKDVPLTVTAELGRTKMLVKEILKLGVGSVINLEKEAGEPIDILVNNKLIARGEVVELDGNFGIRLTEILNK
ncbi:MAG: flagellar motor switch protein FliN [Armatimonadetes bacterium]|nr:flagellar motor switch protein FliN [Armatimonadota bacterium]